MAANSKIIYHGKARIKSVAFEEFSEKFRAKFPMLEECDCFGVHSVETPDGAEYDVKTELSHRELSGKMLEIFSARVEGRQPNQMDVVIDIFVKQGLIPAASDENAVLDAAFDDAIIGRDVNIVVSEDVKDDGTFWPPKARFISPFARITGDAKRERLAMLRNRGKAQSKTQSATLPPPIPAPDDGFECPF